MAADPAIGRADARGDAVTCPEIQVVVHGLYEHHAARVLAYCRRRLRSREEAEDALQTTFLYACRGLQRGVVPKSEIAWLLKIAHNVCLSTWDSDRRRRRLELVQAPERLEALTPAGPSEHESVIALEDALGDLTDLQRRAILLREWRGLSYSEIAEELELSRSAVETLIFRARRTLARGLERQDVEQPRTLVRCLDFGGLFASLKSALGLGGSAKVAVGLLGAAVLAGSIPDTPERPTPERSPTAPPAQASAAAPVRTVDPATFPTARGAGSKARQDQRPAEQNKRPGSEKTKKRSSSPPGGTVQLPPVRQTVRETVQGVTGTLNAAVDKTVNETLPGVVDDVVDGDGGLLP